jgi:hypothetical protein
MAAEYVGQYGLRFAPELDEKLNRFRKLYQSEESEK